MAFKKNLQSWRKTDGQAIFEYFVLLTIVALLTIVVLSNSYMDYDSGTSSRNFYKVANDGVNGVISSAGQQMANFQ